VRLGFVVRNEWGEILLMGVWRVPAKWGVEEAEAATILYGLTRTLKANYDRIVLESDSLRLISRLHYEKRGLAAVDLILENIRAKIISCSSFLDGHVKRGGNTVAHLIARLCPENGDEQLYFNGFLRGVQTIGEMDL